MLRMTMTIAALASLMMLAPSAFGDTDEARRHYEKGLVLYNLQHFNMALERFSAAYVEQPDPVFLFNVAQCQRQLGQYEAAAKSYRAFLAQAPDSAMREEVLARIADMDKAAAEARSNAKQPPMGLQAPPQSTTPSVTRRRPWFRNPVGMTLTIAGIAGVAVGAGLLGLGVAYDRDVDNASNLPDRTRLTSDASTFTTAGGVTLGVGGAALLVGVIVMGVQR